MNLTFYHRFLFKFALAINYLDVNDLGAKVLMSVIQKLVTQDNCCHEAEKTLMIWMIPNPLWKDECAQIAKLNQTL